jgi:lipid A ethanolaminephosphotransferase
MAGQQLFLKRVADRVAYEDYKSPEINPLCDVECRDEGMLDGLQDYIDRTERGDIFIVLHQMGNHGRPTSRDTRKSSKNPSGLRHEPAGAMHGREIENAYANAVLYTDYFLSG